MPDEIPPLPDILDPPEVRARKYRDRRNWKQRNKRVQSKENQEQMILQAAFQAGKDAGCPVDQMMNFLKAGQFLQPRQLQFAAACRLCDYGDGPTMISAGGGRGSSKTHGVYAQMFLDDAQRLPGCKILVLRKISKGNIEQFEEMRARLLGVGGGMRVQHEYQAYKRMLTFANGSWAKIGHYKDAKDIEQYMGLEYDIINVGEATQLPFEKVKMIASCLRTSKTNWRPRMYLDTNPGGIGHGWYKNMFIDPWRHHQEFSTRHIQSTIDDNKFVNAEYKMYLDSLTGWLRRAWRDGDWDIAAGQFFTNWREPVNVLEAFDETRARRWMGAFDYGWTHWTVFHLACEDEAGNVIFVDTHRGRNMHVIEHACEIKAMLARHHLKPNDLDYIAAGRDCFCKDKDGTTIEEQYTKENINLLPAEIDRINGWSVMAQAIGDSDNGIKPTMFVHRRCGALIEQIPLAVHNPNNPQDIEKQDADAENGAGGDDDLDCARFLLASNTNHGTVSFVAPMSLTNFRPAFLQIGSG